MKVAEMKATKDYQEAKDKIKSWSKGKVYTVNFAGVPKAKKNALQFLLRECCDEGLIESVAFDLNLLGDCTAETFVRL